MHLLCLLQVECVSIMCLSVELHSKVSYDRPTRSTSLSVFGTKPIAAENIEGRKALQLLLLVVVLVGRYSSQAPLSALDNCHT